jgi:hypothetical protein
MKKSFIVTLFVLFVVVCTNGLKAQTGPADLNQVELMKQFVGTWENKSIKDTVYTAEFKPYGSAGLEFNLKSITKGKQWMEMKQLWGYDKKSDKIIATGFVKDSPNFMLQTLWFTAKNRCEQIPLEFASNPEKANFKVVFDIKSPDVVLREEFVNNKSIGVETYTRVKN